MYRFNEQTRSGHALSRSEGIEALERQCGNGDVHALDSHVVGNIDGGNGHRVVAIDCIGRGGSGNFFTFLQ